MFYDGEDITHLPAREHAARGIVVVPGGRRPSPCCPSPRTCAWPHGCSADDESYVAAATQQVFDYFPVLQRTRLGNSDAGNLSGGEQQMLALAQAFLASPGC